MKRSFKPNEFSFDNRHLATTDKHMLRTKQFLTAIAVLLVSAVSPALAFDWPFNPYSQAGKDRMKIQHIQGLTWTPEGPAAPGQEAYKSYIASPHYDAKNKSVTYWHLLSSQSAFVIEEFHSATMFIRIPCSGSSYTMEPGIYAIGPMLSGAIQVERDSAPVALPITRIKENFRAQYCPK